tara:strand:- start:25 stop:420 length:396 start_codon:yes stop_codon:yes gene_type:complete
MKLSKSLMIFISILVPIFIISYFIRNKISGEEYQCLSIWRGKPTSIKLKRQKNLFNMINSSNKNAGQLGILFEDKNSLVLGRQSYSQEYNGFYLFYLNKDSMKYRSTNIINPTTFANSLAVKNGECILNPL